MPKVIKPEEVERLLKAPRLYTLKGRRDRAMLELMYATGLRVSELVNLRVADLDIETCTVRVMGKGGRERVVPILAEAVDLLEDYLNGLRVEESPFLFPGDVPGRPLTRQTFWKIIKKYAAAAGIETNVSPHTLRHSFATHLIQNNANIAQVSKLLGHSKLTTTMIYTHLAIDDLRDTVDEHHPRGREQNGR